MDRINSECVTTKNPSLAELATYYKTDKEGGHHYAAHYQFHFESRRFEKLNILEIGIGGYENPKEGGASLRMWKAFFPNSNIYGLDIHEKSFHNEERIKTFKGSQIDEEFLKSVVDEIGRIDIIIDDGSHVSEHIIKTFQILFPYLSYNGIYVVEDLQTSYWENVQGENWGGSRDLKAQFTSMNFLKDRVDRLNYEEFTIDQEAPSYFDKMISSMHFYHNLAFIYKGLNCEGSNVLGRRTGSIENVLDGKIDPNTILKNKNDLQCRWLNIELSSVCNLRCRWCILDHDKPKEFLEVSQFEDILKQIANGDLPFLERIDIHNGGEVFLHPQIDEILLLLDKYRPLINPAIHIAILTNGTVLQDPSLAILSQKHPVDEIRVSVDGGSPDQFEYIRTNAKWNKVSENVKRLHSSLTANHSNTKLGIICMVAHEKSLEVDWMTPEFRSVVELADNLEIRHPHTWEGSLNGKDGLVAQVSQKHKKRVCMFLKKNMVVMANGDVTVCCADLNGRGVVGSVGNQNLSEIMFDKNRSEMIELWQEGRFDEIPICSTCQGHYDEPYPQEEPKLTINTEDAKRSRLITESDAKFEKEIASKDFFAAYLVIQSLPKHPAFEHIQKDKMMVLEKLILEERKNNKWTPRKSTDALIKAEKLIEKENYNGAKKNLLEILNHELEHVEALNDLSVVSILENNFEYAHEVIKAVLKIDQTNEIAHGNLNYLQQQIFQSKPELPKDSEESENQKQEAITSIIVQDSTSVNHGIVPKGKGLICLNPFYEFEIDITGKVVVCCTAWLKHSLGNMKKNNIAEIWNGQVARYIRRKMYKGEWQDICNASCPTIVNYTKNGTVYKYDELHQNHHLTKKHVEEILAGKDRLEATPTVFKLSDSKVCNLKCKMCSVIHSDELIDDEEMLERRAKDIQQYMPDAKIILMSGNGDPFARKDTRELMMNFDGKNSDLEFSIVTNGLLLPRFWDKVKHQKFESINISMDAPVKEVYEKIRYPGKWEDILKTLDLIKQYKTKFRNVLISMVVMRSNYKLIPAFNDMVESYGFNPLYSRIHGMFEDENIFEMNDADAINELRAIIKSERAKKRSVDVIWQDLMEFAD